MDLATYLKSTKTRAVDLAGMVGVSKQTMFKYIHGLSIPPVAMIDRIRKATEGQVTFSDFVGNEDRGTKQSTVSVHQAVG